MSRRDDDRSAPGTLRRSDPLGKRALFEAPVQAPPDQLRARRSSEGRDMLFSVGPRESGTSVITCSACKARTRVGLSDAAARVASFSIFDPIFRRAHPHRIKCPSCHEVTWCRIGWTD